ncbi:hypothetical protein J0H58_28900 [bacterium]|nr:hypothetical protein [bacterium]
MTSGDWQLTTAVRAGGTYLPANGVRAVSLPVRKGQAQRLGFGTAGGRGDLHVVRTVTVAAGAGATLDLYDGSLLDVFGQPAPFRTLRAVAVWVDGGGDAAGVDVGADGVVATPAPLFLKGTTPRATVYPGGPAYSAGSPAGLPVSAGAKNLLIHNPGAAAVTVIVALAGASA